MFWCRAGLALEIVGVAGVAFSGFALRAPAFGLRGYFAPVVRV